MKQLFATTAHDLHVENLVLQLSVTLQINLFIIPLNITVAHYTECLKSKVLKVEVKDAFFMAMKAIKPFKPMKIQ